MFVRAWHAEHLALAKRNRKQPQVEFVCVFALGSQIDSCFLASTRKSQYTHFKAGPIRPKGQVNLGEGFWGHAPPKNFEIAGCNFMHFGGQCGTENELFMIVKLDVASSAVNVSVCKS